MGSEFEELLSSALPFSAFSQETRAQIAALAQHRQFRQDEFVTLYGASWPFLSLVERGIFQALKESAEGRALSVLTLERGNVFWGLTFFVETALMPVTLKAETEGSLALWSRDVLKPLLVEEGEALWSMSQQLVRRMQEASSIVEDLAFQPVAARLAKLLLKQYPRAESELVERDLTLDEMAARVGTTREMVCRMLYRFADDQLIHITRTEFTITNKNELTVLAGESTGKPRDYL